MSTVTQVPAGPGEAGPGEAGAGEAGPVELTRRLDAMGQRLEEMAAELRAERLARERWAELVHELMPVAQGAMQVASDELEDLSRDVTIDDAVRFARTAARSLPVLERMLAQLGSAGELAHEVTALSGAGMASLSDGLARAESRGYFRALRHAGATGDRMASALNRIHARPARTAPSAFALMRELRDPRTRTGLATLVELLKALGPPSTLPSAVPNTEKE